jgi:hypothetical protein
MQGLAGMHAGRSLLARWKNALREFFVLSTAARRLADRPSELRRRIRCEVASAVATMLSADGVDCPRLRLELAERALGTLLPALAAAHGKDDEGHWPSIELALAHAATLPGAARHEQTITHLRGSARPSPPAISYRQLARSFAWLEAQVEARTARELWVARCSRAALLIGVLVLSAWQAFGAHNLARRAAPSASSSCGGEPPPPLGKGALARLVDGRRHEDTYAVCTKLERGAWVALDLGRPRTIDEVIVYSRNDCCWGKHDLPVSMQLSLDNQEFVTVDTQSTPYSAEFPWRLHVDHQRARYVRLISLSGKPREIVLSELEVYGR